jgi:DNA-binding transcriptional MerR regulator
LAAKGRSLRAELAKRDLTFDPQFEEKFVKPEARLLEHVKQVSQTFGADPNEVDRLLNLPGAEFQAALESAKLGSVVKQQIMNSYMDLFKIRQDKQIALANAHKTQAQFAEARRQEHQNQLQQMTQARNQTFAQAIRNTVAADTTGFFAPKEGFSTPEDARAAVLAVKSALDQAPGVPPTQHFENQVKLMYKGAAFDKAVAKLQETQQRLDAVLAEAKRLNIPITISQGQVQVPAAVQPVPSGPMNPQQLLEAAKQGRFSQGGDLHKFGNR